jgi:hypothetical protein
LVAFFSLAVMVSSSSTFAYLPFDGADAAVADPGGFEVEFQPVDRLRDDTEERSTLMRKLRLRASTPGARSLIPSRRDRRNKGSAGRENEFGGARLSRTCQIRPTSSTSAFVRRSQMASQ